MAASPWIASVCHLGPTAFLHAAGCFFLFGSGAMAVRRGWRRVKGRRSVVTANSRQPAVTSGRRITSSWSVKLRLYVVRVKFKAQHLVDYMYILLILLVLRFRWDLCKMAA